MNFYKLVDFLHREALLLSVNASLVTLNKLTRIQKK